MLTYLQQTFVCQIKTITTLSECAGSSKSIDCQVQDVALRLVCFFEQIVPVKDQETPHFTLLYVTPLKV